MPWWLWLPQGGQLTSHSLEGGGSLAICSVPCGKWSGIMSAIPGLASCIGTACSRSRAGKLGLGAEDSTVEGTATGHTGGTVSDT